MKAAKVKGLKPDEALRANAARILSTRLSELRGLAEGASEPGAARAQHDMRIAAKRLRYALELTEACFGPAGKAARHVARELQGILGDLRDAEAMLGREAGVPSLDSLLRTRQELLFARFQELWGEEETVRALAALEEAVD